MNFNTLKKFLKKDTLILGIGNTLRGDDGFGSLLTQRLNKKIGPLAIDAGSSPENFLGKIVKRNPAAILIVDAVDFGGSPGELKIFLPCQLQTSNFFSTHNASVNLLIKFLQENLSADIMCLAAQPKDINFGEGLSPELALSLEKLESFIVKELADAGK
ncbi:MAG: hydrogenase 3 maturation endopeptidase HyCI [Candidatus Omnitrophota bacterium]